MLDVGPATLLRAHQDHVAVAAFTTYTLEFTRGVCEAAAAAGRPVIVQAGSSSFRAVGRAMLAASALAMARQSPGLVGVHLDHATDLDEIRACIDLGYSSVMVDGSHLGFEDNVALTRTVVADAHRGGVWVEAELGAIAGDEARSMAPAAGDAPSRAPAATSPAQAAEFAERTGVDALAVAIGNVHGLSPAPVHLDLELLGRIASVVAVPLVLHGASGLADTELVGSVRAGVAKVNFNAELRRAYLGALRRGTAGPGDDVSAVQVEVVRAIAGVAGERIRLLS